MEAGRELDALVAERVMGLEAVNDGWVAESFPNGGMVYPLPEYSTDIAAAWRIVEILRPRYYMFRIFVYSCIEAQFQDHPNNAIAVGRSDTPAHAICLAALKAIGYESEATDG